ncbi:MAG: WD40 repeat domain-containing protein [Thermoflexales bacterium]|nr:WD40 repeat domain-containing protein [Thermoflexales bacterium]
MVILDVLAVVLLYAFVAPYVWISLAFVIAAFRVRRVQPRKRILGLLGHALYSLWYAFWPVYALFLLRDSSELWFRVIWYVLVFIYPILLVSRLQLTNKVIPLWRKVGYAELKELLLFRPPSGEPLGDDLNLPDLVGSTDRRILWIVAGLSLCVLGLSSLGIGLQTCQWLDIATGRSGCLRTLSFDSSGSADEIAFSPDGRVMAASIWNGLLQFYNSADGAVLWELPRQQSRCGQSVTFSPDNEWVATISADDNSAAVRDVDTGKLVHSLEAITNTYALKFSPDSRYLVVNVGHTGLYFWRTTDWAVQWIIPVKVRSFSFSEDGRWLAALTADRRVGIWKMTDATVYQELKADTDQVVLSPDGTQLATTSLFGPIQIWDVSNGQLLRTIPADTRGELAYSPDGQYLVVDEILAPVFSYIHQVSFWRLADGQRAATLPAYFSISCAAFSAKSDMFAYGDSKSLKVFRLRQH